MGKRIQRREGGKERDKEGRKDIRKKEKNMNDRRERE